MFHENTVCLTKNCTDLVGSSDVNLTLINDFFRCRNFGVITLQTKTCLKINLYEIWSFAKICHAKKFCIDMHMSSVNRMAARRAKSLSASKACNERLLHAISMPIFECSFTLI